MTNVVKPAILSQQADPLWSAEQKDKFRVLREAALVDYDRALLAPGQQVDQSQLKDLAQAIARANASIAERGEY